MVQSRQAGSVSRELTCTADDPGAAKGAASSDKLGRGSRRISARWILAIAIALLMLFCSTPAAADAQRIILWGGPGSVTINGHPAPPGTLIWVGVGTDPQEFPYAHEVQADGSWRLSIPADWPRIHIYVDGFRVPGGPFDETVPGVEWEMRLDVGADTDPAPRFLGFHVRRADITLFDRPAAADATICSWIGNEWQGCQSIGEQDVLEFQVATASRGITFTVDSFPVVGASYDADPADAPFWITLHAGDPEHPPFRFYGVSGDVSDLRAVCEPDDPLYIHALGDHGWETRTTARPDGSWSFQAPSGTTRIRIYASTHWYTHQRYIAQAAPRYDALPTGGSQRIELDHTRHAYYLFYGTWKSAGNHGRSIPRIWARAGSALVKEAPVATVSEYGIVVPYGTQNVSLWIDGMPAASGVHDALVGPRDERIGNRCSKRVDLVVLDTKLARLASVAVKYRAFLPLPIFWSALEQIIPPFLARAGSSAE